MNSALNAASAGLPIRRGEGGGGADGGLFRARFENDVALECDDATRKRFMSAFRTETQHLLGVEGATIHGWEKRGPDEDLNGFSWEYTWKGNNGILQVRYHPNGPGRGLLTLFCYEHIRGATPPPRAIGY